MRAALKAAGAGLRIALHDYAGHPFVFELSREMAARGHTVRHFYFAGDIGPKGWAAAAPHDPEGFSIEPIAIDRTYSKSNLLQRRAGDRRYGRTAAERLTAFRPDVILAGNTPLDALPPITEAARRLGAPFVFWVQDLYGLATSLLLKARLPGLGHAIGHHYSRLEASLLRAADEIVVISEDFVPELRRLGLARTPTVIPNWGPLSSIAVTAKDNAWARTHGLAEKFVLLYSGTLGLKHDPGLLWRLSRAFADDPAVRVVVASSGVSFQALKARQGREPNPGLVLLPLQPIEVFQQALGAADVLLALLDADAGRFSAPSKVLSYLCAGRPVLLSAPLSNQAVRVVEASGGGVAVDGGDPDGFIAAARRLHDDAELRTGLGVAARTYAEGAFRIEAIADRFELVLHTATRRKRVA